MPIEITQADFNHIGKVAKHCNKEKLEIAINEAIIFDLRPLLCSFFNEVDANWDSVETHWRDLIDGGTFVNCDGEDYTFYGLKKILTYLSYARYVVINNFDDTPNGGVTKTNDFSIPKPLGELRAFSNKYKNMGHELWEKTEGFLCINKSLFASFDDCNCSKCGCNGKCCGNKNLNTKGFGYKGTIIER